MQKLIDLNDGQILGRGVFPSLAENQKEVFLLAKNVEFKNNRAMKATGYSVVIVPSTEIRAIAQAYVEGEKRVYWAENSELFVSVDGVPSSLGVAFPGQGHWSLEVWGNWLVATNEEAPPQVWKNVNPIVDLGGFTGVRAGRKYRFLKKHKEHMLGYFGQQVDWSHESDIEQWEPAADNSAGGMFLRDLDSDITCVCAIGTDVAIYSGDKLVIQAYNGAPFYFSFNVAIDGIGAVGDYAAIPVSHKNYVMSKKGFSVTDGISAEAIDNPMINEFVFGKPDDLDNTAKYDPSRGRYVVGVHVEKDSTVKWWYDCLDNVKRGVSFKYDTSAWGILEQPVTAAAEHEVFDAPIIGTQTSLGFLQGSNLGNDPMVAELATFPFDGGDRERYKQWDMYRAEGVLAGMEVRFGFQDTLQNDDGSVTAVEWTDWATLIRENYIERESVFLRIEIRSTGIDTPWRLEGFSVHGVMGGYL